MVSSALSILSLSLIRISNLVIQDKLLFWQWGEGADGGIGSDRSKAGRVSNGPQTKEASLQALQSLSLSSALRLTRKQAWQ